MEDELDLFLVKNNIYLGLLVDTYCLAFNEKLENTQKKSRKNNPEDSGAKSFK